MLESDRLRVSGRFRNNTRISVCVVEILKGFWTLILKLVSVVFTQLLQNRVGIYSFYWFLFIKIVCTVYRSFNINFCWERKVLIGTVAVSHAGLGLYRWNLQSVIVLQKIMEGRWLCLFFVTKSSRLTILTRVSLSSTTIIIKRNNYLSFINSS